jgi:hypothetical protein
VLYVYLDQAHWISLLKAETGHPEGLPYEQILGELREKRVELAVFPLSSAHYIELNKISNEVKRSALGALMMDISYGVAILPYSKLLPMEIDRALQSWFGRPKDVREAPLFGFGGSFAFGIAPPAPYEPAAGVTLPDDVLAGVQLQHRLLVERAMWTWPSLPGQKDAIADHFSHASSFVQAVESEREALRDAQERGDELSTRERLAITVLTETPDIRDGMARAGVAAIEIAALGSEILEFVEGMPSMLMTLEMRLFVQSQPQRIWSPNDLVDLAALSIAIPYCDIVVTEKQWAHLAKTRHLDTRFGTHVISDLKQLPKLIDELSDR